MRQTKFTVDQIIKILAEAELPGSSVQQVARKYNISLNTIYRWRTKYKGLSSSEAKRLKVLEEENFKLKKTPRRKRTPNPNTYRSLKKSI